MPHRLRWAFLSYGLLALAAGPTLDGKLRIFLWVLLGGLALKTWAAAKREL
jgi:hypothetical protein